MRDVAVARVAHAIDQFIERPPHDLPDGLLDKLKDLRSEIDEFTPEEVSPGRQAAREKMPLGNIGEKKDEELSPGKKAANEGADRGKEAVQAVQSLAESIGREGT